MQKQQFYEDCLAVFCCACIKNHQVITFSISGFDECHSAQKCMKCVEFNFRKISFTVFPFLCSSIYSLCEQLLHNRMCIFISCQFFLYSYAKVFIILLSIDYKATDSMTLSYDKNKNQLPETKEKKIVSQPPFLLGEEV